MQSWRSLVVTVGLALSFGAPAKAQSHDWPPEMLALDPRRVALMDRTLVDLRKANEVGSERVVLALCDSATGLTLTSDVAQVTATLSAMRSLAGAARGERTQEPNELDGSHRDVKGM